MNVKASPDDESPVLSRDQGDGSGARPMTKRGYAEARLREMILSGSLPPGTRLRLRPLASELGVSVMPVRDALRALEAEGLVEMVDHGGTRVSNISREEILETLSLRSWLEIHAVREAATRHTTKSIAEMREVLDGGKVAVEAQDGLAFSHANRRFHELIEAGAGSLVTELIGDLWNRLWQARRQASLFITVPERMAPAHEEHEAIFNAVAAGDPDAAAASMERHRTETLRAWETALTRSGI